VASFQDREARAPYSLSARCAAIGCRGQVLADGRSLAGPPDPRDRLCTCSIRQCRRCERECGADAGSGAETAQETVERARTPTAQSGWGAAEGAPRCSLPRRALALCSPATRLDSSVSPPHLAWSLAIAGENARARIAICARHRPAPTGAVTLRQIGSLRRRAARHWATLPGPLTASDYGRPAMAWPQDLPSAIRVPGRSFRALAPLTDPPRATTVAITGRRTRAILAAGGASFLHRRRRLSRSL